jgi:peroxiredoxin
MRKLLVLMAFAAAAAMAGDAPHKAGAVPRKASEFVFKMADGQQQLLSQYKGKTVVLAFMFTTCPHCQKLAQELTKVQQDYAPKGVQVIGAVFDQGAPSRLAQFNKQLGLNFPVGSSEQRTVLDFLQAPPNDPYFVPILVFIDKQGMIRSQFMPDETSPAVNVPAEIDKVLKRAAAPATAPKP